MVGLMFSLPFIDRFYQIGLETSDITLILSIFLPTYFFWLLTLFTTGYLYGRDIHDCIFASDAETKFYYATLDANYKIIIDLPRLFWQYLTLIFDNEDKIKDRIKLHKSIAKDYKKEGNKMAVKCLDGAIKINENELIKYGKMRKKHGHWSVFWYNLKEQIGKIFYAFITVPFLFYLTIIESFVSIFPSLSKQFESNEESKDEK